ncbi:molybdenum cofactor biosynthesis protein MoaE [Verrucomicrobiaceae bacterium 227]
MFKIQDSEIDLATLRAEMADPTCGALVIFEGLVRNHHEGRDVEQLHYTHHPVLATKEGQRILAETMEKFPITKAIAIHRVGTLAIGDCAVVTLTSSPHREAAFDANRFLIDSIKARVPIWKQETYTSGEVEWTSPCPNCGPVPHQH